jgi:electron transfer flavoprotein beta subunit
MKSLVCVSNTPDTTAKISFTADNKAFNKDGVNYIMNPYDEWYALVKAIEIKEQHGGEVTILHVGEASSDIIIRKALAIGGDKAVRINKAPSSSWDVAHQIVAHVKQNDYNLIFLGKETIDHNGGEVGALVAELLDWSYVSLASDMKAEGDHAVVTRDIEGGTETVKVGYPLVISAAKGLAEQRIPNMRGIMMAKRKPLEVAEPIDVQDNVQLEHFALPPAKSGVKMVDPDNMDELVRLLHEEAKVI